MRRRRWFPLALLAAIAIAGCGAPLPATNLPVMREVMPVAEFPPLRDYRGAVDVDLADSGLDQSKLADIARAEQIDFVTLANPAKPGRTDFGVSGYTGNIVFIPGGAFHAAGGTIIGANLQAPIQPNLSPSDLIAAIHDQGGIAIAADPAKFAAPTAYALADAMEVYNQQAAWDAQSPAAMRLRGFFTEADRLFTDLDVRSEKDFAAYDTMAAAGRVTLLAGFGAPENMSVVDANVGTFEQWFMVYTTHLLAPERAGGPLLDAMRQGHCYVSFDLLGYVGAFVFYAQNGAAKILMGGRVPLAPGLALKAQLPAKADRIVLYRNGAEAASAIDAATFEFAPKSPGAYRIEAYRQGRMWILSNPVYVR